MKLPQDFIADIRSNRPKEGALRIDPGWFQLWPEGKIEGFNIDYAVAEFAPGFVGFGSNGGGEMLAFDGEHRVYSLPFIGMSSTDADTSSLFRGSINE